MPSRSDQLQSHQFAVQRMVAALAAHQGDPLRTPTRRAGGALLAGLLVMALGLAGFAVWGLLRPGGSTRWRDGGAVIVERESGAKLVYRERRLHPVANYASAALIVGANRTVTVARRSLAGVPRGPRLGIAGAPDALPARGELVRGAWQVCSRPAADRPRSLVLAGGSAGGPAGAALPALLVSAPDGSVHLLWQGRRTRLREPDVLVGMLVWPAPAPVAAGLVDALSATADLARVPVAGRGQPFAPVAGARVGQVFLVDGRQHALALAGGLAPITGLQAALLLGDPATVAQVGQKAATGLSAGEYAAAPRAALGGSWDGLPAEVPRVAAPPSGAPLCAGTGAGGQIVVGGEVRGGVAVLPGSLASSSSAGAGALADEVYVRPGGGVVVAAMSAPDAPSGPLFLVTDLGVRHPVPTAEVLSMLGYAGVAPQRVPAEVVGLLPLGPALDPEAAGRVLIE
jgi:type VII secretion protein EccB